MLQRVKRTLNSSEKISCRGARRNRQPPACFERRLRPECQQTKEGEPGRPSELHSPSPSSQHNDPEGLKDGAENRPVSRTLTLQPSRDSPQQKTAQQGARRAEHQPIEIKQDQPEHFAQSRRQPRRAPQILAPHGETHEETTEDPCGEVIDQTAAARHEAAAGIATGATLRPVHQGTADREAPEMAAGPVDPNMLFSIAKPRSREKKNPRSSSSIRHPRKKRIHRGNAPERNHGRDSPPPSRSTGSRRSTRWGSAANQPTRNESKIATGHDANGS